MGLFGLNEIFSSKGHETKGSNEPSRIKRSCHRLLGSLAKCAAAYDLFGDDYTRFLYSCAYWKRGKGIKAVCLPRKDLSDPLWI